MQCFCFVFIFVAQLLYKKQKCEHERNYSVQQVSLSFQYKRPKCHVSACFSQCSLEDSLLVMSVLALSQLLLFKVLSGNVKGTVDDRHCPRGQFGKIAHPLLSFCSESHTLKHFLHLILF